MKAKSVLLLGGLLLAGANAMACYTVYGTDSRILYQGHDAPVDMRLQLHEALAQRFPRGAEMVFNQGGACLSIGAAPGRRAGDVPPNTIQVQRGAVASRSGPPAPLLTDRETAERNNLPHTVVAGDIVVVPPAVAEQAMRPSVTVLPSTTFAGTPDTSTLGAGPARSATRSRGAAANGSAGKPNVVITELRDPPVTIIEGGGGVTINKY